MRTSNESIITFDNVTKTYDDKVEVLNNLSVKIDKGEFVFIIGKSGSGKSTFLKLLQKEIRPSSGKIYLAGDDITYIHNRHIPLYRRNIGVIFQDFRLLPQKNVAENISFAMEVLGFPRKIIKREVSTVLSIVGLSHRANQYPHKLSGGEQQKVSIARAIINNPPILIADEPTGNLDPETSWGIMELLRDINRRGTTILMATHDRDIVNKMEKRVIMLSGGTILRDDKKGRYLENDQ